MQPSLVRRRDGTIVAYMRDNGPPPKRIQTAFSRDDGLSWSTAVDTEIPIPGSSCQVRTLKNGLWVLVYNDTERGRHSLAVSLSDDEGKTWKWTRHVEGDAAEAQPSTFRYPSLWEARVGDELLKETAQRIRATTRVYDLVGRLGGEELVVVHPDADYTQARTIAGRIWDAIRAQPYVVDGNKIKVAASLGVASLDLATEDDLTPALRRADRALYSAKKSGRDRVV